MSTPTRRQFARAAAIASAAVPIVAANDRLSIAIIGCGGRGTNRLLREILELRTEENIRVTAVCDTWRQQREKAAAMVKEFTGEDPVQVVRFQDVLARNDVDAVVIATPDHLHCTMLTAAARAGKDAYVEKPLAMTMEELNTAVDAVKRHNRIVQVGTQIRSYPHSVAARQFVTAGKLGPILKAEQSRNSYKPYWHSRAEREATARDVDWDSFLLGREPRPFNAHQYAGWYGYREFSRGPHAGLMVHFIDLVHFVTGAKYPWRVVALGGTYRWKGPFTAPDSIEVILEYSEGFLVRYSTAFGTRAGNYLKFFGTRGAIDATRWSWDDPWILSGEGSGEPDRVPDGAQLPVAESVSHMKNWLMCLRSRQQPAAPIETGYAHSVASIMADEAYLQGKRMVHDPNGRRIYAG
ncbi:MAG: Gfo/Idh/MocA family oxidoreductase [bacterium]|nr:Gfo/Idh/MocA family oxidoreductase [bacterium]